MTPLNVVRLDRAEDRPTLRPESTTDTSINALSDLPARPPIVLLHGFTGDASTWEPFADAFCEASRAAGDWPRALLALDLVGHGASAEPGTLEAHSISAQSASILAALEDRGVLRAIFCGYSMGGRIALSLAVADPERVAGLILIGASAGIADPIERVERREQDREIAQRLLDDGLEAFIESWSTHPLFETQRALGDEHLRRMRAQRMRNRPESLARSLLSAGTGSMTPLHASLRSIEIPTLIVAGAVDTKFTEIAAALVEQMPNARLQVIEGVGHAVQLEAPAALADAVAAFVRSVEDR